MARVHILDEAPRHPVLIEGFSTAHLAPTIEVQLLAGCGRVDDHKRLARRTRLHHRRPAVETLEGLRKQAVLTSGGAEFTIYCDEAAPGGKPSTAPSPMAYFAASILF